MKVGKVILSLGGAVERNNIIYGITKLWNFLLAINIETGDIQIISVVPEWNSEYDYVDVLFWENCLILVPLYASKIWIYSLDKDAWESIDVPNNEGKTRIANFCTGYIMGDYLYLPGHWYKGALKIDLKLKEVIQTIPVYENVLREQVERKDGFTFTSYAVSQHKMYIASGISNRVHIINLEDDTCYDVVVGDSGSKYSGIAFDGSNFWLAARYGSEIIRWDGLNSFEIICVSDQEKGVKYRGIFRAGQYIVADGLKCEYTVVIDYAKGKIVEKEVQLPTHRRILNEMKIWAEGELLFVADRVTMKILNSLVLEVDVKKMKECLGGDTKGILSKCGSIREEKGYDLRNYIEYIQ